MTDDPGDPGRLDDVRRQIDAIDSRIVALIAERQNWVIAAGTLKDDEESVRSPDRVEQVVAKVRALAKRAGGSPEVVERTYRALISAFIDLELGDHRHRRDTQRTDLGRVARSE